MRIQIRKSFMTAVAVFAVALFVSLAFATSAFANEKSYGWERLDGASCFETAAKISNTGFDQSDTVIISTWDGYWDALSASSLAGAYRAPILYTWKNELDKETIKQIRDLNAKEAIIVGGEAAVSGAVENELKGLGLTVSRFCGATAVDTSTQIADRAKELSGADTCIIATSGGFYDALSVAPFAYYNSYPLYLAQASDLGLSASTQKSIKGNYANAIIVGGNAAVSSDTEKWLKNNGIKVTRLAGDNAWETSAEIAHYGLKNGLTAKYIGVADGNGYWDALTGSALCGSKGSPLVLVPHDGYTASGDWFYADNYCIDNVIKPSIEDIDYGYIFGGTAVVTKSTEKTLNDLSSSVVKYTVCYSDGADGTVFADQSHLVLKGKNTPKFEGADPVREGYTFMGWSPKVTKTVKRNVTYTAIWAQVFGVKIPKGLESECIKTCNNIGLVASNDQDDYEGINAFSHEDVMVANVKGCPKVLGPVPSGEAGEKARQGLYKGQKVDIFVKAPVLYYRVIEDVDGDGKYDELRISDKELEGYEKIPGILHPDENGKDCLLYAKYSATIDDEERLRSVSGNIPLKGGKTLKELNFQYVPSTGEGYTIKDVADEWYIKAMWLIKYATKDSQSVYRGTVADCDVAKNGVLDGRYSDGCPNPQSGTSPFLLQGLELSHGKYEYLNSPVTSGVLVMKGVLALNYENHFDSVLTINTDVDLQLAYNGLPCALGTLGYAGCEDEGGLFYVNASDVPIQPLTDENRNRISTRLSLVGTTFENPHE